MPTQNFLKFQNLINLFLVLGTLVSCSFRNESLKHFFSEPTFQKNFGEKDSEEILILSTNSFLGQLESMEELYPGLPPIKVGGSEIFTSYVDITREKYPQVLFLDGGNIFSLNPSKTLEFYSNLNIDGVALSDSDLSTIQNQELDIKLPFINSNFINLKTGKSLELKGLSSSKIFEKGKIKIAVFSVVDSGSYTKLVEGINAKDTVLSLLKEKDFIGNQEVHINVLMASIKTGCYSGSPNSEKPFKEFENFQLICPKNDKLFKLISRLPPNFIDLIILNNNFFADGFIGEIPIIQNPGKGKYLSRVKITFNLTKKRILKNSSSILPPLKTCHHFFSSTEDCHLGKGEISLSEKRRIDLIIESGNQIGPAIYLGEKLQNWTESITN